MHTGDNPDTKNEFGKRLEEIWKTWKNSGVKRAHTTSRESYVHANLWKQTEK